MYWLKSWGNVKIGANRWSLKRGGGGLVRSASNGDTRSILITKIVMSQFHCKHKGYKP